jgi:hypothetical protein
MLDIAAGMPVDIDLHEKWPYFYSFKEITLQ